MGEDERRSGICMNVRTKIFLLLSAVLLGSIMLYVWIYSLMDHQRLQDGLVERAKQTEYAFRAEQDSTEMRMLQIATFVAHEPKVQQLFLLGKHAVELEGGGTGGELAGQVRTSLYEHIRQSQEILAKQFGFKQLHFHLGPGALSFLRMHRPEKFGDRLDKIRHSIVTANAKQKNTMGLETGRLISGIRGAAPVYAVDGGTKEKVHVGALEAVTSFPNMLSIYQQNRPWLNAAVLLSREHLQANVWPDFIEKLLEDNQFIRGFRVEATTSSEIEDYLGRDDFAKILLSPGHHTFRDGEACYSFISFPLRDFQGETDPTRPDVGLVILWRDISAEIAAFHNNVRDLIIIGIFLFMVIELLMFFGLKLMTQGLRTELEQTREHEIASENARLVAEKSSRLKTQFLNNMSHELRTPMNAIMGFGEILRKSSLDNLQQDYVDKINQSSKKLLNLINEVLLIAEVDAQESEELSREQYNPTPLVNGIIEKFAAQAEAQGVNLNTDYSDGIPGQVNGRPAQLESILSQLLGNAVKFSHTGDVTLSLKLLDRNDEMTTLEYAVTDQGIGISKEQQELIFQPFQQGDGSTTRSYGGTGLGLTIAQKICRQLGGEIVVESSPGHGSRFSFQLKYKTLTDITDSSTAATIENSSAAAETVNAGTPPPGTIQELDLILQRLEDPLAKMQPCQNIANELKARQWPENLSADIVVLTSLIAKYRFVEAQEVVTQLKESFTHPLPGPPP